MEAGNNGLTKTKYLTFGIHADSMKAAKPRIIHIETDILNNFKRLGVQARVLNGKERLALMHQQFHMGDREKFNFDWKYLLGSGLSVKDFIAPSSFSFPIGFVVLHKQQALDFFADEQKKPYTMEGKSAADRLHRYYWELTQRMKEKPHHPGESDEFIPEAIRGKHYNSWTEIAKDLGYGKES